jgi:hypothetical protein
VSREEEEEEGTMTTPPAGPGSGAAAQIDWMSLINDFGKIGQKAADTFTKRAAAAAQAARDGTYSTEKWLDDVELFWKNLAEYAKEGIDICRKLPKP